MTFPGTAHINT